MFPYNSFPFLIVAGVIITLTVGLLVVKRSKHVQALAEACRAAYMAGDGGEIFEAADYLDKFTVAEIDTIYNSYKKGVYQIGFNDATEGHNNLGQYTQFAFVGDNHIIGVYNRGYDAGQAYLDRKRVEFAGS